jgi:hypothetical protein
MSPSATRWPPHAGSRGVAGSQNPGLFPPVCPPPGNHGRTPTAPSPCCARIPSAVQVLTPLPTSVDHGSPPKHLTNVLPKRRSLS